MSEPNPSLPAPAPRPALRALAARLVYWTPVLVPLVLFAQVAFLGLRPALCEKRRLSEASVQLERRHERDLRLAAEVSGHVRARSDPVFLERQRRLRELPPAPDAQRP